MLAEGETVSKNQPRKRWHFVVLRSLLVLERGIFWLLYWLARRMESDDVFLQEDSKARSHNSYSPPNSPADMGSRINNPANNHRDRTRAISLPQVPGAKQASFNPVKDFISNIVNRKGQKKRASLKRSVTTGNVTDEKAAVRYVGRGHSFISCHLRNPTWCDCCGEFIWGLFKQCVRCKNCKYTCHRRCRDDVDLDCTGGWHLERNLSVDEMTMKTLHLIDQGVKRKEPFMLYTEGPTGSLLSEKIDEYNSTTTGLIMTTRGADTYQGFIRVHMNLLRPINIVAGERPLSIFETVGANKEEELKNPQRTSFFLPLGTVKALHVTSDTTVHEVIVALLKKFKVADNPRKFALFECYQEEDNHMILRRMSDIEKPLVLRLLWGGADIRHNFSLQENETGDIVWEVFSMPELQNFMKILDKEEEEHISLVQEKYRVYKERLEKALALVDEEAPDS